MKTKQSLFLLFLLISFNSCIQFKVSMQLKNGKEINDKVKPNHQFLVSTNTKEKYHFDDVSEIKVYKNDSVIEYYYPLNIKYGNNSNKISHGLGMKVYDSEHLEIFHARFSYFKLDYVHEYIDEYISSRVDTFIRRKGESYAYSIACIDAMGCDSILERVLLFFDDCPKVIEQIVNSNINQRDIIKIADYYNAHCGKN
jgi:hypothetical protein